VSEGKKSRAGRVLTGANYDIRSADIIQTLSWDTLDARRLRAKSTLGDLRFAYEYKIEYENDFSIVLCRLHIITTHTHLIS